MSPTNWKWNGARWWSVDFHAHSMASFDYGKDDPNEDALRQRTYDEWLLDFMRAGIDCVVIADHNTGLGIDLASAALTRLQSNTPPDFRPLVLFPGVELSVQGGVHVLAVFAPGSRTSDVDSLLGAVGYRGTKGSSDGVTDESFVNVIAQIDAAGGIAIPAHVDTRAGFFREYRGETLRQASGARSISALEMADPSFPEPAEAKSCVGLRSKVLGSDSHHPTGQAGQKFPGSSFTWVKMASPTHEGLRLALVDGPLSLLRSDSLAHDPNAHADNVIESVTVASARYIGRPDPFILEFNPWLNALIGGRGTGKSSIVEFLRLALQRRGELPSELEGDFAKYFEVHDGSEGDGLLEAATSIEVVYQKQGGRFRITWEPDRDEGAIEMWDGSGHWVHAEGDVARRFPARIYSQKQILNLARDPKALMQVVDEAPEVADRDLPSKIAALEAEFLALRAQARQLEAGLAAEPRLRGELQDVQRLVGMHERTQSAEVQRRYHATSLAKQSVDAWEDSWFRAPAAIRTLAAALVPAPLDPAALGVDDEISAGLVSLQESARQELASVAGELELQALAVEAIVRTRQDHRLQSDWQRGVDDAADRYREVSLELQGPDSETRPSLDVLLEREQRLMEALQALDGVRLEAEGLRHRAKGVLEEVFVARRDLTAAREGFLNRVLAENRYVRIRVLPYADREGVERDFRRLIGRLDGGFQRDIGEPGKSGLLERIGLPDRNRAESYIGNLKQRIIELAGSSGDVADVQDMRFVKYLRSLPPSVLDAIELWFPADSLSVQYKQDGEGTQFTAIRQGSPGQKTAALLAFLLSYGDDPLVIDQPEDDLDNHLIYDLIVRQMRQMKVRRQIVVVTHNANIVVNGDAELVVAFAPGRGGATSTECNGSLQDRAVRDLVCQVMEGGLEAFQERYRRIALLPG